jgi:cytochrome c oxidase cbb3-type subunit III
MDLKRLVVATLGTILLSRDAGVGGQPAGPTPDPAAIARGTVLYEVTLNCAACHGLSGRGGPNNTPDLTASALAIQADGGRGLAAFLQVGRPERGMPPVPVPLTESQAADLSAKLRSFAATEANLSPRDRRGIPAAGGRADATALPPALTGQDLSILIGDPKLGKRFFNGSVGRCSSCHSVVDRQTSSAANLAHIATKYPDAKALQNAMLLNRGLYWSPRTSKDIQATITYTNGRTLKGYLTSVSDFKVVIRDETGSEVETARQDGEPKVTLSDRLQHHLDLLERYHDNDIHNLTAYLATLR